VKVLGISRVRSTLTR